MEVSGELTSDEIWEGDVALLGDVVVPEGMTLRLRAGTALSFAAKPRWSCAVFRSAPEGYPIEASSRARCDLVVFGRLEVDGTAERPILLGRPEAEWGGVTVLGRGSARVEHARASGAGGGEDALFQCFDDAELELRNCVLSRAKVGVLAWGLSSVRAHETLVEDVGCAFLCRHGSTTDLFRTTMRRAEQGVWEQNWALARLEDCRFENCSDFGAGAYDRSRLTVVRGSFEKCGRGLLAGGNGRADALAADFRDNRVGVQGHGSGRMGLKGCRFTGEPSAGVLSENDARIAVRS